ncbi:MAG: 8-amino-7-oxononanoate synthase, partial [Patescibacteria group bacterium]|nr:8-amino-7-oxononanoate synthase [Patescibacteria group bacterium]
AANSGTIAALAGPGDLVLADRKSHASLLDGCRLSRADYRIFAHNDADQLDALLEKAGRARRRLVVVDSLFSMDGDLAPLADLVRVCRRRGAMLLVDEAHATGVFGPHGRGVAELAGVEDDVTVRVGTLSKALGCAGGFVVGSRALVDWLVNRARPYVFSTAMPAPVAGAALAALDIVRTEAEPRRRLLERAAELRQRLHQLGWNVGASTSQIIPVIVGHPAQAVAMAARLLEQGFFVPAVRPPTVPDGESCLRISLTTGHDEATIERLLAVLGTRPSDPAVG